MKGSFKRGITIYAKSESLVTQRHHLICGDRQLSQVKNYTLFGVAQKCYAQRSRLHTLNSSGILYRQYCRKYTSTFVDR